MNKEDILELEDIGIDFSSKLILWNDDVNTFDHVINCLIRICKHSSEQAEQCSMIIHTKGKAVVKSGDFDELRVLKYELTGNGLNATIE